MQTGAGLRAHGAARPSLALGALAALVLVCASSAGASPRSAPRPPGLTPAQLHAAYELPAQTAVSSSQTIALIEVGGDPTLEADLAVYDSEYGLPKCTAGDGCLRVVNDHGNANELPSDSYRSGETSLDVQEAHAICQNCHLLVIEGNPAGNLIEEVGAGVNLAVADGATEVTICIELYADASESQEAHISWGRTKSTSTIRGW